MKTSKEIDLFFNSIILKFNLTEKEEFSNCIRYKSELVIFSINQQTQDNFSLNIGSPKPGGWTLPLWLISKFLKLELEDYCSIRYSDLTNEQLKSKINNSIEIKLYKILNGNLTWYKGVMDYWSTLANESNIKIEFINEKGEELINPENFILGGLETISSIRETALKNTDEFIDKENGIVKIKFDTTGQNSNVIVDIIYEDFNNELILRKKNKA